MIHASAAAGRRSTGESSGIDDALRLAASGSLGSSVVHANLALSALGLTQPLRPSCSRRLRVRQASGRELARQLRQQLIREPALLGGTVLAVICVSSPRSLEPWRSP